MIDALYKYSESLENTIIKTVDDFTSKYEAYNKKALIDANKVLEQTNNYFKNLNKAKEKYFKESKALINCNDEEGYKAKMKIVENYKKDYTACLTNFNNQLEIGRQKYIKSL